MRRAALILVSAVALGQSAPGLATQPVQRPDPAPASEALVPCESDRGTTALLPRLLRVRVNGAETREEPVILQRPCGALLIQKADLERLRIKTAGKPTVLIDDAPYLNLNQYDGLTYVLDPVRQILAVEGEPRIFYPSVIDFAPPPAPLPAHTAAGAFLNYGGFSAWSYDAAASYRSANAGLGVFGDWGVVTSDWFGTELNGERTLTRLATTYTRDILEQVASFRAGDVQSRGGSFGTGAAVGGLQYSTNFGTRPRMQIAPVQMMESATRRNAVLDLQTRDVWDEEARQRAGFMTNLTTVPYGPVELVNMPTYNNGEYELTLRDYLGGETTVRQPFFFNDGLLRAGLSDYSVEAGWLRRSVTDDIYQDGFGAATWRRGISNTLTAEVHGEAAGPGVAAGGSAAVAVPYWGVLTGTVAGTRHDLASGSGAYGAVGLENRFERVAYGLRADCQDQDFLLPSVNVLPVVSTACRAYSGITGTLPWKDSLGLSLAATTFRGSDATRSARIQYGLRPVPGAYLLLYMGWTNQGAGDVNGGLSFSYSLGARVRRTRPSLERTLLDAQAATLALDAAASREGTESAFARVSNAAPLAGGTASAQVGAALVGAEREIASMTWSGPKFIGAAGVQHTELGQNYTVSGSSALVWMDHSLFLSAPLYGSFALVRLGRGNGGVEVNGQRTDADGDRVVAPLLAYYPNAINVNPADLASNARLDQMHLQAVPRYRSGVLLRPEIRRVRSAMLTVRVRDEAGAPVALPVGAFAMVAGGDAKYPTGEDGEVYVEGLQDQSTISLSYLGQVCVIEVRLPPASELSKDSIPELGPYECEGIRP